MSKKILIQVISAILFEILFFSLTLQSQTNNFYEESFKLKQASESYDERGYLKNGHYSGDGNLLISDFDGNVAYNYPISSTSVNGSEVNVSLNYSGSVGCTSFAYYDFGVNAWRTLNKNRAAWILGVNGFAVQVFGEANFFTNKPHINGLTWDIFHNAWSFGVEPNDPWYSKTSHTDADINWVIDGYDYSNSMTTPAEIIPFQDVIKLLKSDGSILELRNVAYLRSSDTRDHWAEEKYYTGTYYENAPDAKGFAVVEFIKDDFNIERPPTISPYSNFTDNAYDFNKSPFWPRRIHYFPGDGMEYVFREYTMPYGREILFVNDPTGDYPLANCVLNVNSAQYYKGKKLAISQTSFGANYATPTIFYLDEIYNKYRKIVDFTYSRHHPWKQQVAEQMHDYTRGRALLKSFLNHKITYSSNYATIETPTHSFTLLFGQRKVSGWWDESVQGVVVPPDSYYYTRFDELENANKYMLSLDKTENYYSWLDYITQIREKDISSTTIATEKQTNFEYESYTRNYKGINTGAYQYYFPKVLAPYGLTDADQGLNMTINDYRLTKVINPDRENVISYKTPQNISSLELPLQSTYSGDFLYYVNNTAQEMDKYGRVETGPSRQLLMKSEYSYDNVGRSTAIYDPAHDGCFALCSLKVTDMIAIPPKVIQKQTWYENFMLTSPASGVFPLQFLYKTNLLKKIETSDGVTRTNWNVVYHPTATNDGGVSNSLNMIFLPRYSEEDIQYTNQQGAAVNIVKSCSSFDYQLSQKYNTTKIRDYGSNDYQSEIYNAFGFDILEQTQSVWNPLDVNPVVTHPGRPLSFKNGSRRLIVSNKKMFSYLPYKNNVAVTVSDQIFNFDKTLKEYNRQLYDVSTPSNNIIGKSLDETTCFVEQNDPVSLTSKTFPPVFGILKSDKTYNSSGTLLTGTSKDIIETPNSGSAINYGYGNASADYIISKNTSATITTKALDYTTGYKFGGLINSVTAPNSAVTNLYYDYSDAHSAGYWPVGNAPQPDLCSPGNAITGVIKTNKDNSFIVRLKQGLYQYYTSQPYVNKQTVRKYQNGGTSLASTYIANIFNYDPNGNIIASLDPNGWLTSLTYDIYQRNQQINLPLDFIDLNNISGKLPLPLKEQLVIRNSGVTRFNYQSRQVQCTTCITPPTIIFHRRTNGSPVTNDVTFDMLNLYSQSIPEYFGDPTCVDDPGGNCNIQSINPFTENLTPKWYGSVLLAKPANMMSITGLDASTPVTFKIYIDKVVDPAGLGVWLTVNFPGLNYSNSYQFYASTTSANMAGGTGFLEIPLPAYLNSTILSLLNSGTGIKVELTVTTNGGKIEFSNSGYDKQPALILNGTFNWNNPVNYSTNNFIKYDYTLQHTFDFLSLESHRYQKVDDAVHTNNTAPLSRRELDYDYAFGADYKVLAANRNGGNSDFFTYFGNSLLKTSTDKNSQTTSYLYDETGRNTTATYPDAAQTTFAYKVGKPSTEFSLLDEDYYGYCYKKTSTDNKGTKSTQYYDAFDRLRKEVADEGASGLNKTIQYQYDVLGRLTHVINPKYQHVRYWYDGFGRVKYKYQPDMGVVSYAYDNSGNIRFSQNEEQSADKRVTYYEYDDLNRLLVMGEAKINNSTVPTQFQPTEANFSNDDLLLNRLTDVLDPNTLHFTPSTTLLTDNKTLWLTQTAMPGDYLHLNGDIWPNVNCVPLLYQTANQMLGIDSKPQPPLLMHSIKPEDDPGFTAIAESNFENFQSYPQSLRMVSYYDALPPNEGSVWGNMPTSAKWNAIAPISGMGVRNLKGKVSAIAYREHGGQPFNYMVFSYDERGRVEAMLRYTQNLTYDAVYYKYNSNNDIISVKSVDPARSYNAWYGYDSDGRLQNIWSAAPQIKGFCGNPNYPKSGAQPDGWDPVNPLYSNITSVAKPTTPDVGYSYNTLDLMSTVNYFAATPAYNLSTTFTYNSRKWLTRILTIQGTGLNFDEQITYDANKLGLITNANTHQFNQGILYQNYSYDNLNQLTHWGYGIGVPNDIKNETITYDPIGNRTYSEYHYPPDANAYGATYNYNPSYGPTPNGLSSIGNADKVSSGNNGSSTFTYNQNGALIQGNRITNLSTPIAASWQKKEEKFHYDVRGLVDRYTMGKQTADGWTEGCWSDFDATNMTQWSYWYNPFGEREQKRTYYSPAGDNNGAVLPWTYYQLGIKNQQYVVYNGFQISDPSYRIGPNQVCLTYKTPPESNVFIYPTEYNIYGGNSSVPVSYKLDANGAWQKSFKIFDHIGSVRQVVSATDGTVKGIYDYEPFGREIKNTSNTRTTFIDKEKDHESDLGDFGVRKYDFLVGRFTSIDPLWEKGYGFTPYNYSSNNPICRIDKSGLKDYVYTSQNSYTVENDHGWFDFLFHDNYYIETTDKKRYKANSKKTVTATNWKNVWIGWGTSSKGLAARVSAAIAGRPLSNPFANIGYVAKESREGNNLDQKHNLIISNTGIDIKQRDEAAKGYLYEAGGIVFNNREAGNVVWGASMFKLGFSGDEIDIGANGYALQTSIRNSLKNARFQVQLDEPNEVQAFHYGYFLGFDINQKLSE